MLSLWIVDGGNSRSPSRTGRLGENMSAASVREQSERLEHRILSPNAAFSDGSRGRLYPEEPCPIRTIYQRDRDRIIHSNAFRRLKDKTQVFLAPVGDHYRTRLTHTLEVSQISRTIARALRLNEDLTEAIALGHDLGHTPFGHAGEAVLDELTPGGFKHYLQSVRVVTRLEQDGKGLNLSWEVKNGIAGHSTKTAPPATLEGRIVRISDKIAYLNHDIDDARRAGVLSEEDVPYDIRYVLGRGKSQRITTLVCSVIEESEKLGSDIVMADEVRSAFDKLKDFMYREIYLNPSVKGEEGKAKGILYSLYQYYYKNPDRLPEQYCRILEKESKARAVCDYLSGMSDHYAAAEYEKLFLPKFWEVR